MKTHNVTLPVPEGFGVRVNGVFVPVSGETIIRCKGDNLNCIICQTHKPGCNEQHPTRYVGDTSHCS